MAFVLNERGMEQKHGTPKRTKTLLSTINLENKTSYQRELDVCTRSALRGQIKTETHGRLENPLETYTLHPQGRLTRDTHKGLIRISRYRGGICQM